MTLLIGALKQKNHQPALESSAHAEWAERSDSMSSFAALLGRPGEVLDRGEPSVARVVESCRSESASALVPLQVGDCRYSVSSISTAMLLGGVAAAARTMLPSRHQIPEITVVLRRHCLTGLLGQPLLQRMRVLVAMSGGVDSSVAAARLVSAGHEVVGVTLHLWDYPDDGSVRGRCCAPEDVHDARRVAEVLGIPHFAFDRRELFLREVVEPFVDAYVAGATPSPCVGCNRGVKMNELMRLRDRLGAEMVATGHYARVVPENGGPRLYRGRDAAKDQSYFLHMLPASVLSRLTFPLGASTKQEVRAEAKALQLPGAEKGESQELCFVASGHYAQFVLERAADRVRPGPIVDALDRRVGEHGGIHAFTLGQRRNLGVAIGHRAYVTGVEPDTATVRLGERADLMAAGALVEESVLADDVALPLECEVAVRYRGEPVPAVVDARPGGSMRISFRQSVYAVVKGQYAVMFRGDRVLGGGRITGTLSEVGE